MKFRAFAYLLLVIPPAQIFGTPVTGDSLSIPQTVTTSSAYNTVGAGTGSGALGLWNSVGTAATGSLAVGINNTINEAPDSMVVGSFNGRGNSSGGFSSLLVGNSNCYTNVDTGPHNYLPGCSLFVGTYNSLSSTGTDVPTCYDSIVAGYYNTVTHSSESLVVGDGNTASLTSGLAVGTSNVLSGPKFAMGKGLVSTSSSLNLIFGTYNIEPTSNQLLVVGNGYRTFVGSTPTITQGNALVIQTDGTMILPGNADGTSSPIVLAPGSSQITIGGKAVLTSGSTAKLQLGTGTSTSAKLQVEGRDETYGQATFGGGSGDAGFVTFRNGGGTASGRIGYATSATEASMFDISSDSSLGQIRLGTAGVERMRVDNFGNVGIGTSLPQSLLSVQSGALDHTSGSSDVGFNTVFAFPNKLLVNDVNSGQVAIIANDGTPHANYGGSLAFGAVYDTSAHVAITAGVRSGRDNATSGNYAGYLSFSTRPQGAPATERMRISSSGNVGVGTNSPQATLDINGSAKFSGTVTMARQGDVGMGRFTSVTADQ